MPVPKTVLKAALPKAGFVWARSSKIFPWKEDDAAVRRSLLAAARRKYPRRDDADRLLSSMFTVGAAELAAGNCPKPTLVGMLRWLEALRANVAFACDQAPDPLPPALFARLFRILLNARTGWHALPAARRQETTPSVHHALADAIDNFRALAAQAGWEDTTSQVLGMYMPQMRRLKELGMEEYERRMKRPMRWEHVRAVDEEDAMENEYLAEIHNQVVAMVLGGRYNNMTAEEWAAIDGGVTPTSFDNLALALGNMTMAEEEKEEENDDAMDVDGEERVAGDEMDVDE